MDIDELIAKLEQASEGSWFLNYSIMVVIDLPDAPERCVISEFARQLAGTRPKDWPMVPEKDDGYGGPVDFENHYKDYTRSIDAALTLVPHGANVELSTAPYRKDWRAYVWLARAQTSEAPTPSLALCIAALKARRVSQSKAA